jgi:putative polyhydroxyalkanoate system protein
MPKFDVDIPHSLPPEEARSRIAAATPKLEKEYGAKCTWNGDRELSVSRKGLDARVSIEPERVHIELNLGFLLTAFSTTIKNGISKELSGILSRPSSAPSTPSQA